jgi:hypothetical protein
MSTEFVKQTMRENLTRVLVPHVADGLWSIYENAKTACERNKQPEKTLQTFQNLLTSVTKWTPETLKKEVERIITASKCDYIEDLLLGVFVSYIRAFASLQQNEATHVNIEFERPSLETFVHNFYVVSARKCWTQAYLFNTIQVPSTQQARNRRDIEVMLDSTIGEVVDFFIPWRGISQAYFQKKEEPRPTTAPPVTFAPPEVHEFETDDEDSEEERPKITLGEDITLSEDEDTEDELEKKATETVALNL